MINYIMIHHSAVSYTKNADQFKANNAYHKAQWNFKSSLGYYLGYNYEISSKGKLYKAREDGETTAACYQQNMNDGRCIHICLDGNFDTEKPKPAQIFALRDLLKSLVEKYDIKNTGVIFHNAFANKTCPGGNLELGFVRSLTGRKDEEKVETKSVKEKVVEITKQLLALVENL